MSDQEPDQNFVPVIEAGRRLGLGHAQIYVLLRAGRLPGSRRFWGRWLVSLSGIRHYQKNRRPPGRPRPPGSKAKPRRKRPRRKDES